MREALHIENSHLVCLFPRRYKSRRGSTVLLSRLALAKTVPEIGLDLLFGAILELLLVSLRQLIQICAIPGELVRYGLEVDLFPPLQCLHLPVERRLCHLLEVIHDIKVLLLMAI